MPSLTEVFTAAIQHHQAGRLQQAEALYRQILQANPNQPETLHLLGVIAHQVGRNDIAIDYINKAIAINPAVAEFHNNIGEAYRAREDLARAIDHFRRALSLKAEYAEAYNNMGNAFQSQGELRQAEASYKRALAINPQYAEAYNNLGNAMQDLDDMDGAVGLYRRALELKPGYADAWGNLGNALRQQGKWKEAEEAYRKGAGVRPSAGARIKAATVLPVIYDSPEEVKAVRRRFAENLSALSKENLSVHDPMPEVGVTNFYLAYQAGNDRDLQVQTAKLYERACPSLLYTAPHCAGPAVRARKKNGRIKIGFVSRFFRHHSIGKSTRGLLANLSREKFSVCAFFLPPVQQDDFSAFIRDRADKAVALPGNLAAARERIAAEDLDILYYQDIGMEPFTYFLAFSRLAPVQCVRFGHPVTTGIGNIDYFISTENFEPKGGDAHYSEKLVRLKSIGASYFKPPAPDPQKPRSHFGLEDSEHLYLCPQVLFKFHPDFDPWLKAILERDPKGRLVLLQGRVAHWADMLQARFKRTMPRVADRVTVLPPQSWADFINLIAVSDVMLDTIHFGGFNSSLEAFAFGMPVVTWPGEFMRGRHTYAMYKEMGFLDGVAKNQKQYVDVAVRLGTDVAYRKKFQAKILAGNHVLFESPTVVAEYEKFFEKAAKAVSVAAPVKRKKSS